jgi:signal transduction histidine kinase
VQHEVQKALANQHPFQVIYRITTADGAEKWVWEQGRKVAYGADDASILEGFITDTSERVMAQHQLEQRVSERTRQLTTLLEISQHVTSTLDMQALLGIILDQLHEVVDYTAASIFVLENNRLCIYSHRGPIADLNGFCLSLDEAGANREVIERGEPVIIADVRGDTPLAQMFQATAGDELYTTFGYIRSWMGVPLMFKERVVGMLTLDHAEPDVYTPAQARFVLAFAQQAGAAIENARLYDQTWRHAEETEALLAVQQALTSRLDPDAVLQTIADAACRLTDANFGTVFLRQGDDLCVSVLSGDYGPGMFVGYCMPVHGSATGLAMLSGTIVRIDDGPNDRRVNQDAMQRAGLRSLMGVPLLSNGEPMGVISVGNKRSGTFGVDDERILTMLAPGAVIALENARLYQAEQERRQEAEKRRQIAEGLRDVLTALNSNLPLDAMLATIAAQAQRLLEADAVAIYRLHEDDIFRIQAYTGLSAEYAASMQIRPGMGAVGKAVQERQPVAIRNTETFFTEQLQQYGAALPPKLLAMVEQMTITYCALVAVPLLVKDESYGAITLYYHETRQFAEEEIALSTAFADQVALAIESARFSEQVQQAAAMEERQRLARDLHDAVTQTLFSASMIADVLPRLWERKPEEGTRRLNELRQLTRGALAEMRTLLLELRPAALREANLGDVLHQLGEAVTGRARLPVTVTVTGEEQLPADVRVAFYRIAQEAMNNIIKHANAHQVDMTLNLAFHGATLYISDDGRGFDPASVDGGHFGLRIMRERAEAVAAALHIESQPGQGTTILITWNQSPAPDFD